MPGKIFCCLYFVHVCVRGGVIGIKWPRMLLNLQCTEWPPTTKNFLAPNVHSFEGEKPWVATWPLQGDFGARVPGTRQIHRP